MTEHQQTPPSLLIGLSGMPRAGKDTVSKLLEKEFPGITLANFSHAIAEEYDAVHGTNTRYDEDEKILHRHGFGALGNKRREEDPFYWVKIMLAKPRPLIIAGVRGLGEADAIREAGGILIRIEISDEVLRARMGEHFDNPEHHIAEHHLNDYKHWDYIIRNEGTFAELEATVHDVAEKIRAQQIGRN